MLELFENVTGVQFKRHCVVWLFLCSREDDFYCRSEFAGLVSCNSVTVNLLTVLQCTHDFIYTSSLILSLLLVSLFLVSARSTDE